jgi:uncharacterized protein YlxW (UPF0749 family)
MRFITIVLALAACGEVQQTHRWPHHRREKDAEIASLLVKTDSLEKQTHTLAARIKQLEQQLAKLQQAPQPSP